MIKKCDETEVATRLLSEDRYLVLCIGSRLNFKMWALHSIIKADERECHRSVYPV